MKNRKLSVFVIIFLLFFCISCKENTIPRPKGYFRIELKDKHYVQIPDSFPYQFEIPSIVQILNEGDQKYWINLLYPSHNAEVHISYYQINGNLQQLLNDTYSLTYKHSVKADAINEILINYPQRKVFGTFYDIKGDAASQLQFFVTDSVKNYFRAALYFYNEANRDSLNPVIEYIKNDMNKMIETFEWNYSYN